MSQHPSIILNCQTLRGLIGKVHGIKNDEQQCIDTNHLPYEYSMNSRTQDINIFERYIWRMGCIACQEHL